MSNNGKSGFGATIAIGDGATPENFAPVAEVYTVGGLKMSRSEIDRTTHESPDGWKESTAGLKEPGDYTFEAHMIAGADPAFVGLFKSGATVNFKTTYPTGAVKSRIFPAYVKTLEEGIPLDDRMVWKVGLKIAGRPDTTYF